MNIREFLIAPLAYLAPEKALDGLSAADAERKIAGAAHSVAEIVAHLAFWQDWFHARCRGEARPMVTPAAVGWPAVAPNSWPAVRDRFVGRLSELAALGDGDIARPVAPPIEFPPLAEYTIGDALVHVATHNAPSRPGDCAPATAGRMATAGGELDVVASCQLSVTSYQLPVTSCQLAVGSCSQFREVRQSP